MARDLCGIHRSGRRRYRDLRYCGLGPLVELDGESAHPTALAWRDRLRDNDSMLDGDRTPRYGWREVVASPCMVAGQVTAASRRGGWTGAPRRCGPGLSRGDLTGWLGWHPTR